MGKSQMRVTYNPFLTPENPKNDKTPCFHKRFLEFGAQDWTRTSTLLASPPQDDVSTNSTTWAL